MLNKENNNGILTSKQNESESVEKGTQKNKVDIMPEKRKQSFFPIMHKMTRDMTKPTKCAPSEDSDQPGHPSSLIRVFAVRMKKPWVLSYPLSA